MRIDDVIISAGDMRERIQIQSDTISSQNSYGEAVNTWATVTGGTVWAEAKSLGGREAVIAKQMTDQANFAFILRYFSGVTTRHRVVYRTENYDINAVINVGERRIKTVLLCQRTV